MLPKKHRMSQALAHEVFVSGTTTSSPFFLVKVLIGGGFDRALCAVSVSKKIAPSAVDRNRTRRRVYSVLRGQWTRVRPGAVFGIVVKKGGESLPFEKLIHEVESVLVHARVLQ